MLSPSRGPSAKMRAVIVCGCALALIVVAVVSVLSGKPGAVDGLKTTVLALFMFVVGFIGGRGSARSR